MAEITQQMADPAMQIGPIRQMIEHYCPRQPAAQSFEGSKFFQCLCLTKRTIPISMRPSNANDNMNGARGLIIGGLLSLLLWLLIVGGVMLWYKYLG